VAEALIGHKVKTRSGRPTKAKLGEFLDCTFLKGWAKNPDPDLLAQEIVEELEAALEQFRLIAEDLGDAGAAGA
jgi:hypothetical protein